MEVKGKGIPHYRTWRPTGDVAARVHIFTAMALGRGRVASPTLGRVYPRGKPPVLVLQEAEWTSGPVWTRRSEEKSPPHRHPGSNPGRPARSPAPCRLSNLDIYGSILFKFLPYIQTVPIAAIPEFNFIGLTAFYLLIILLFFVSSHKKCSSRYNF